MFLSERGMVGKSVEMILASVRVVGGKASET